MAQDIFLKLDGIEGGSRDSKHKGEIDVLSWQWQVLRGSKTYLSPDEDPDKTILRDLTFSHFTDRASQGLMQLCMTGKRIAEAILLVRTVGSPLEYLKFTMSDVAVTHIHSFAENNCDRVVETVSLSFSKIKQEYDA